MGKRYLSELSELELKRVIEVNPKLEDELIEYYLNDEDLWVEDAMKTLTVDGVVLGYSISPHSHSYIDFDKDKALTSLGNINNYRHNFGLYEEIEEELDKALEYLTFYEQSYNLLTFEKIDKPLYTYVGFIQNEVYNIIWDYVKRLSEMIVNMILDGYKYDDDTIIEALVRKCIEDESDSVYVKDDTYIAYKEIPLHEISYER